ncbi:MAG: TetR/AcrR family transcriptional regulator [Bacteroidales bacterium]|jgi:AcrR family transcriptional regulator|nr:TetR/AcrR family transcriptional regulator [Bacteroidales bacterium]
MNATKEHIIFTSFRMFLQKGYREVTMSMLVKATGLSKGAFYHYFENKEQLFGETLDTLFFSVSPFYQEPEIAFERSFYESMGQYIENIKRMGERVQQYLGSDTSELSYYRLMLDVASYAPEFRAKIERANRNELIFWQKIVRHGIDRGELKPDLDLEILARHFHWLQDGIAINSLFYGETQNLYHSLEKAFVQLYQLIKK